MTGLVPGEAVDAACAALHDWQWPGEEGKTVRDLVTKMLEAAAPVIVADALKDAATETLGDAIRAATDEVTTGKLPEIEKAVRASERGAVRRGTARPHQGTAEAAMITQRFLIDDCILTCPGCGATLTESRLEHHDDCAEIGGRQEIAELRERIRRQAAHIREMQVVAERKNRELDALHLVWCDGGCGSGVHRWHGEKVSAELVAIAERNTKRLKRWYSAVKWRLEHYKVGTVTQLTPKTVFKASPWHEEYARRNARKTDLLKDEAP